RRRAIGVQAARGRLRPCACAPSARPSPAARSAPGGATRGGVMSVGLNGIAHIQLTVRDPERCIPFWERLCHFFEMQTLIKAPEVLYCIGSRTGILVRGAPPDKRDRPFDQDR